MKILIATGLYPPEIGGPATYTVLLESELPKLGYEVIVVPFSVSRSLPKIVRHVHYFVQLIKKSTGVKVIFAQDVVSVGLPALFVAKLLRKKFVVRVPGDYAWEQSTQRFGIKEGIDKFQTKKYGLKVELLRLIQKIVTRHAHAVITPSEYFNELVCGWGVKRDRVHTIYNGVDLNVVLPEKSRPAIPTIITAGRLVPWKGFDSLITLIKELPDWNLKIIGDGPDKDRLKDLCIELEVQDRVIFLGSVTRTEIFKQCREATAFVLNTKFESFSYQVVEAMYSGVPVVVTRVGSLPELIDDMEEGVLFEPNDILAIKKAVESIAVEPGTWIMRTEKAQKKTDQFSIDRTIKGLDELLNNI